MEASDRPVRVLVVEDDQEIAQVLQRSLRMEGYDVKLTNDGARALDETQAFLPDLIVLDLGLPGLDGFGAAATIRSERDVPIVALTGHSAPDVLQRAADAGAESYVLKPFSEDGLINAIREALAKRSARVAEESKSYHLLLMVESMVRENMSERDITRAVRDAGGGGEPGPTLRDSARSLARRMGGIVGR
jgi:CheY-like chemotaxis protein